jgi:hypothetical protein
MTEMHTDFLPASGAVVIVICVTSNVISYHVEAFERQLKFARGISKKISKNNTIAGIPTIVLLVDDNATGSAYINATYDFPALVTVQDYTATALVDAVRVLFGN